VAENAFAPARLAEPATLAAVLARVGERLGETLSVEEWAALDRALGLAAARPWRASA
jgi:hypothetical protein